MPLRLCPSTLLRAGPRINCVEGPRTGPGGGTEAPAGRVGGGAGAAERGVSIADCGWRVEDEEWRDGGDSTTEGSGRLPQVAIDSRNQFVYRHRLGEMVISTGDQSLRFVFDTAPG